MNVSVDFSLELFSSLALVLVTLALVFYTYRLWNETRLARKPHIVASLGPVGSAHHEVRLTNAGAGSAVNVDVAFGLVGHGTRRWTEDALLPGQTIGFDVPLGDSIEGARTIEVSGSYEDLSGNRYVIERVFADLDLGVQPKRTGHLSAHGEALLP